MPQLVSAWMRCAEASMQPISLVEWMNTYLLPNHNVVSSDWRDASQRSRVTNSLLIRILHTPINVTTDDDAKPVVRLSIAESLTIKKNAVCHHLRLHLWLLRIILWSTDIELESRSLVWALHYPLLGAAVRYRRTSIPFVACINFLLHLRVVYRRI